MINENYDKIDGKYIKNESNYYHYTNIENFHKLVNSFLRDKGLKGKHYPANTNTYGEPKPKGKVLPNEVCLVRSDRVPDNIKDVYMSGNIGDIKLSFKEDKIVNKFGKIKPIQEFPVQDKIFLVKAIKKCKKNFALETPLAHKILNDIEKNFHKISEEQMNKYVEKLNLFCKKENVQEIKREFLNYHNHYREKMESRIRVPKGEFVTLDLIKQILLPHYLKNNKEILADIQKLKNKGFNNIAFYNCRFPKEELNEEYFPY